MKNPFRRAESGEQVKAVFSVMVDVNYNYRNDCGDENAYLQPGGRYYFNKYAKSHKNVEGNGVSYEKISDFITGVITGDLTEVCNQYLDTPVELKVNGKYDGSLVLVFSAIFNAVSFISGVKDIYDIAELIRDLAKERIEKRLDKEYGEYFEVRVERRLPNRRHSDDYHDIEHMPKHGRIPLAVRQAERGMRDAFFWYLLISNIVLVGITVSLVINALIKVYW
ncbi:MAG: hypothetical protein LBP75_04870 [Planctomycetota bacterium]|jgi:hypothetical protein|nr:hypothetical protein [Planctomycetota bacterium]